MKIYGLICFYENRIEILKNYMIMSTRDKWLLKNEIYSIPFEKEYIKDLMWEYLQGIEDSSDKLYCEYKNRIDKMIK